MEMDSNIYQPDRNIQLSPQNSNKVWIILSPAKSVAVMRFSAVAGVE